MYLALHLGISKDNTGNYCSVGSDMYDTELEEVREALAYERRRIRNPRNTSRRKVAFSCKSFCRSAWLPSTAFYYACVPYWQ